MPSMAMTLAEVTMAVACMVRGVFRWSMFVAVAVAMRMDRFALHNVIFVAV